TASSSPARPPMRRARRGSRTRAATSPARFSRCRRPRSGGFAAVAEGFSAEGAESDIAFRLVRTASWTWLTLDRGRRYDPVAHPPADLAWRHPRCDPRHGGNRLALVPAPAGEGLAGIPQDGRAPVLRRALRAAGAHRADARADVSSQVSPGGRTAPHLVVAAGDR